MHSTRNPETAECIGRFAGLVLKCTANIPFLRSDVTTTVSSTTSPFGFDPTFVSTSLLFQPSHMARAGDFYNASAGHVHPDLEIPYAHVPHALPAYPMGFPYVMDTHLTRAAMLRRWIHLNETGYVSEETAEVLLNLMVYNPLIQYYGLGRAKLRYCPWGQFSAVL